jgi:hypothetical protein
MCCMIHDPMSNMQPCRRRHRQNCVSTVYRHYFSHHFDFFVPLWPQIYFTGISYVGCLYVILASLSTFFCDFIALDARPRGHTRTWPDWCLKPLLFTPVRMQLICHQCYAFSAGRFIKRVYSMLDGISRSFISVIQSYVCHVEQRIANATKPFDCGCVPRSYDEQVIHNFYCIQF